MGRQGRSAQAQETTTDNLWHEEQKEASTQSDRMSIKEMHLQYMRTSLSLCGMWRAASMLAETTAASAAQELLQMHATRYASPVKAKIQLEDWTLDPAHMCSKENCMESSAICSRILNTSALLMSSATSMPTVLKGLAGQNNGHWVISFTKSHAVPNLRLKPAMKGQQK